VLNGPGRVRVLNSSRSNKGKESVTVIAGSFTLISQKEICQNPVLQAMIYVIKLQSSKRVKKSSWYTHVSISMGLTCLKVLETSKVLKVKRLSRRKILRSALMNSIILVDLPLLPRSASIKIDVVVHIWVGASIITQNAQRSKQNIQL
jgi:hypothetical protein